MVREGDGEERGRRESKVHEKRREIKVKITKTDRNEAEVEE